MTDEKAVVHLSTLLTTAEYANESSANPVILDVTEDSREVRPGTLFVAIEGHEKDGLRFAAEAAARGAAAIAAERPVAIEIPVLHVLDARKALADFAAAIHGYPGKQLRVFGITGTDGKTTTCYLLRSILEASSMPTGMITTVETIVGGEPIAGMDRLTTPSASYIQRTLGQMVKAGDKYAVLECSSHALVQQRLRHVALQGAAVTNIKSDHLSFHGSPQAYTDAKALIANLLEQTSDSKLLLNRDDERSMSLADRVKVPIQFFGGSSDSELRATDVQSSLRRTWFAVSKDDLKVPAEIPLGGEYNVYNALAAIGIALNEGIDLLAAVDALTTARTPKGRLQPISEGQSFHVFVDYAHTEQAFEAVLRFLRRMTDSEGTRLITVFGAAGDRDRAKRRVFGRLASRYCDYFVITNEDPFGEDADTIMEEIAAGVPTDMHRWSKISDRREAIRHALTEAHQSDVVLITGKGHENSIDVSGRRLPWNDGDVTKSLLVDLQNEKTTTDSPEKSIG